MGDVVSDEDFLALFKFYLILFSGDRRNGGGANFGKNAKSSSSTSVRVLGRKCCWVDDIVVWRGLLD